MGCHRPAVPRGVGLPERPVSRAPPCGVWLHLLLPRLCVCWPSSGFWLPRVLEQRTGGRPGAPQSPTLAARLEATPRVSLLPPLAAPLPLWGWPGGALQTPSQSHLSPGPCPGRPGAVPLHSDSKVWQYPEMLQGVPWAPRVCMTWPLPGGVLTIRVGHLPQHGD